MVILQLFGEPLSTGGQESFVMNIYKKIDKTKVKFDFFTPYQCTNITMRNEIKKMGGFIFSGEKKFESKFRKIFLIIQLKKFLKNNNYDIVHIHSGSIFNLAIMAYISKKSKIKRIIVHSHATGNENIKHKLSKMLCSKIFLNNATDFFACSIDAAKWKFPKKIIDEKKFMIINNGIDTKKFKYDRKIRKEIRNELNINNDTFVITHVGRFTSEKNHFFIINIFEQFLRKKQNSALILVGDGPLLNEMRKIVDDKKMNSKVIFLGNRSDIPDILDASDCFLFPSIFEGLGISAIEAECNGLNVFCSSNLPKELDLTDLVHRISLSDSEEKWAKIIYEQRYSYDREEYSNIIAQKGFDSKDNAEIILKKYIEYEENYI